MLKKVDILKDDKKELLLEIEENERLGKQVESLIKSVLQIRRGNP